MHAFGLRSFGLAAGLSGALLSGACTSASASREISGAELYRSCESCHRPQGAGDITQGAPAIAGLPEWYLAAQLERFANGVRGKHPDDVEGLRMRPMSLQLKNEAERKSVAAYVAGLPKVKTAATITGADTALGAETYAMCTACHGPQGEGNQAVNAPPIAGLDDWYLVRQIGKFRSRVRGSVAGDTVGPVMAAMSMAIPPEAIDAVAAHVHSLPR